MSAAFLGHQHADLWGGLLTTAAHESVSFMQPAVRGQSLEFPPFCRSNLTDAEPQLCRGSAKPAARIFLKPYHASASRPLGHPLRQISLRSCGAKWHLGPFSSPKTPPNWPGIVPKQASRDELALPLVHLLVAQRIGHILFPVKTAPLYRYQHLSPLYHHRTPWVQGRGLGAGKPVTNQWSCRTGPPAHKCTSSGAVDLTSGDRLDKLNIVLQDTLCQARDESGIYRRSTAQKVFSSFPAPRCCGYLAFLAHDAGGQHHRSRRSCYTFLFPHRLDATRW